MFKTKKFVIICYVNWERPFTLCHFMQQKVHMLLLQKEAEMHTFSQMTETIRNQIILSMANMFNTVV